MRDLENNIIIDCGFLKGVTTFVRIIEDNKMKVFGTLQRTKDSPIEVFTNEPIVYEIPEWLKEEMKTIPLESKNVSCGI